MCGSGVVKAEKDDADKLLADECKDLAKIQVERQNDPGFARGLEENLAIRHLLKMFIGKVKDVVPRAFQPLGHPPRDPHISEKPHASSLLYEDLLLS